MSKSKFFEGLVIGAMLGAIGTLLVAEQDKKSPEQAEKRKEALRRNREKLNDIVHEIPEKTEVVVGRTLQAIEQGFEKISKMIDDRKTATSKRSPKPKK